MQPENAHKPIMDVTAPQHPTTLPEPATRAVPGMPSANPLPQVSRTPAGLAPAVPSTPAPQMQPSDAPMPTHQEHTPVATPPPSDDEPANTAAAGPSPAPSPISEPEKKPSKPASPSNTPVALITMTVLAMLILSGLAVMIYLTSQT